MYRAPRILDPGSVLLLQCILFLSFLCDQAPSSAYNCSPAKFKYYNPLTYSRDEPECFLEYDTELRVLTTKHTILLGPDCTNP